MTIGTDGLIYSPKQELPYSGLLSRIFCKKNPTTLLYIYLHILQVYYTQTQRNLLLVSLCVIYTIRIWNSNQQTLTYGSGHGHVILFSKHFVFILTLSQISMVL